MPASLLASSNRILPALVTPLTASGELDTASLERLVDHLYAKGVGGLYVTGSTGEGVYLDFATRRRIVEITVALSRGRGTVIAHVGATQASQAYELAAHAATAGADAVASIPPSFGGYTWDEVADYYRRLCKSGPLPVVAYYIPALTGQRFALDDLTALSREPGIAGFKFTDTNLYLMQRLASRLAADQIVYHGCDEMLALGLQMGVHGGIGTTYNIMPELILSIAAHCAAGHYAEAVAVQKQANDVIEILLDTHAMGATKQVLVWQGHIATATCAPPRAPLTQQQQDELRKRLERTAIARTLVR